MSCEVALHDRLQGRKVLGVSHERRDRQLRQRESLSFAESLPGDQLQALRCDRGSLDQAVTNRYQLVAAHFPKNDLGPTDAQ